MPEHASRFAGLYDQQNENRIADWGGDELFTRMPSRPVVDDAPAPRFRPSLMLVDAPEERRHLPSGEEWRGDRDRRARSEADGGMGHDDAMAERAARRRSQTAQAGMIERAERLGLSLVEGGPSEAPPTGWDAAEWDAATRAADRAVAEWGAPDTDERAPSGRRTKVITGRPEGAPRPLSLVPAERRRRPARTPAEWIGPRPERIVAWAFVLGLLLILIAISTADAATL